jgi:Glycosyl-hydrolase family 116, catalytic region
MVSAITPESCPSWAGVRSIRLTRWIPQHQGRMVNPMDAGDLPRWGSAAWRMGCYVDALSAAVKMAEFLNEDVESFSRLRARAVDYMQRVLFNGEYFEQHTEREDLTAEMSKLKAMPTSSPSYSPEAIELMRLEAMPLSQKVTNRDDMQLKHRPTRA